jgi:hypothetical protein
VVEEVVEQEVLSILQLLLVDLVDLVGVEEVQLINILMHGIHLLQSLLEPPILAVAVAAVDPFRVLQQVAQVSSSLLTQPHK